jgi:hypothetical protein
MCDRDPFSAETAKSTAGPRPPGFSTRLAGFPPRAREHLQGRINAIDLARRSDLSLGSDRERSCPAAQAESSQRGVEHLEGAA